VHGSINPFNGEECGITTSYLHEMKSLEEVKAAFKAVAAYTAVFTSARCYDHSKFMDGLALNIRIHPSALSREDGSAKLRDMTKTYLNNGGMEVQYNIVSSETMRAAQKDPESCRNLVVRIAGYSAYSVELNTDCQNDIIRRTENTI
jgi:formate C-acetyltransferase